LTRIQQLMSRPAMTADGPRLVPIKLDMVLILAAALGGSLLVNVSTPASSPSTFDRVITQSQRWLSNIGRWLTEPTARRQPG
jgi:hypothetical protein